MTLSGWDNGLQEQSKPVPSRLLFIWRQRCAAGRSTIHQWSSGIVYYWYLLSSGTIVRSSVLPRLCGRIWRQIALHQTDAFSLPADKIRFSFGLKDLWPAIKSFCALRTVAIIYFKVSRRGVNDRRPASLRLRLVVLTGKQARYSL